MGDAGPQLPAPTDTLTEIPLPNDQDERPMREVTVLVTGFGPFKSFHTNPSYLVSSSLPDYLDAQKPPPSSPQPSTTDLSAPLAPSPQTPTPYTIRLLKPPIIRVSYNALTQSLSQLLSPSPFHPNATPDYIFHIGMAGGREHYTLETVAHRDEYKILDVDARDGLHQSDVWKNSGIPKRLDVGWEEGDVVKRWEEEVDTVEGVLGMLGDGDVDDNLVLAGSDQGLARPTSEVKPRKSVVRLSRDAGRFLCEFTLFTSLATRSREARDSEEAEAQNGKTPSGGATTATVPEPSPPSQGAASPSLSPPPPPTDPNSREGKVAFLHVPGGFTPDDIARGRRVAIAAIRSIVGSWEEGRRRRTDGGKGDTLGGRIAGGHWEGVLWRG